MEENKSHADKWADSAANLVEGYRDLITIKIIEHTSLGISQSVVGVVMLVFFSIVLLFLGMGGAWWLGEHLNNMKAGFFIMGGIYTALLLIILLTSQKIWIPRIRNLIIKKIYEQD